MKNPKTESGSENIRKKAEEVLRKKPVMVELKLSEAETEKRVHELEVNQIELEMLNKELQLTQEKANILARKYSDLYTFAPSGYFTLSKDGKITELNLAGSGMLGKERSCLMNAGFTSFITTETRPMFNSFIETLWMGRKTHSCEVSLLTANGILNHIHLTGTVSENQGECYVTANDISELLKNKSIVSDSEEKYRVLFTNSHSVMLIIDPLSGVIVDANKAACRFYGWSLSELTKKNITEINTLTAEEVKVEMMKAVEEKRNKFIFKHQLANGEIRDVESNTGAIVIDGKKYLFSFITDITDRERSEKELKKSERKFRFLVQNSYDIIFSATAEGIFTFVSDAWTKVLGHPIYDVVGKPFQQFIHPDDLNMYMDYLKRQIEKGERQVSVEYRIQHNDGSWRWHSSAITLTYENGLFVAFEGVARDIGLRKKAEAGMLQNEIKHRKMISNIGDVIVIIDRNGINKYKSPNVERLFGWKPEELVGCSTLENIHPKDLSIAQLTIGNVLKEPNTSSKVELRYRCKDGNYKWIEITVINLLHDPDIEGILGNYHDITVRKRADEEIKKTSQHFLALTEKAPDGIRLTDIEGNYKYVSPSFKKALGYAVSEEFTGNGTDFTHPDDLPMVFQALTRLLADSSYVPTLQYRFADKNKNWIWFESTFSNLLADPNVESIIINSRDITERKRAEEKLSQVEERLKQAEKMESIGQLAGGIAHDFNNILTGIIGYTEMSQRHTVNNPVLKHNLLSVLNAAERAKHLTRQILTYSRKTNQEMAVTDIKPIVMEVVDLLKASIPSSTEIESDLHRNVKPVLANSTHIHEVIINLANNAVYAMKQKGKLTIRVYSEKIEKLEIVQTGELEQGEYTVIEVVDTGCGMDAKTMVKAFEPFFTTKTVGEGTGMGLSVVLGIVQLCNGHIKMSSKVGKGTTVKIYLPISKDSLPIVNSVSLIADITGSERILFVDDEQLLIDMAEMEFSYLGYTVKSMSDSREALEFFKNNTSEIDIIITDQTMPGMTGLELAKEVLKIRKDLPIILCTGFSNSVSSETAKAAGIREFVEKPYEINALSQLIQNLKSVKKRDQ